LHSEGIIKNSNFMPDLILKKENEEGIVTVVDLSIPKKELGEGYSNSRSLLSVSSCGICGRTELGELSFMGKTINEDKKIEISLLEELFGKMNDLQHSFHQSGGTHAAAAFKLKGELLYAMEDIGRHNAVDKVIGKLILSEKLKEASILTVSGRVSYEIVIKCFKAGIPFLAAVSAPSSLAVDYAKELGITLFAFCRDQRATCYSNPQRTKIKKQSEDFGIKAS
jgi:FdhD protein